MKIQIKNWFSGSILFETDAETIGAAVLAAIAEKASLARASLARANLARANLDALISKRTILPDGELIGWKKLVNGVICKLKIPADAKRVGGLIGRKCRAEFAEVIEGEGRSIHNATKYKIGQRVTPDSYDPNPLVECSNGIHFFITREEATEYV